MQCFPMADGIEVIQTENVNQTCPLTVGDSQNPGGSLLAPPRKDDSTLPFCIYTHSQHVFVLVKLLCLLFSVSFSV